MAVRALLVFVVLLFCVAQVIASDHHKIEEEDDEEPYVDVRLLVVRGGNRSLMQDIGWGAFITFHSFKFF
ncbi:hypothetical protein QYF36_008139 [Acer negundo]|nr:hypothetical protein QYF36_008139 [Acer negundo]